MAMSLIRVTDNTPILESGLPLVYQPLVLKPTSLPLLILPCVLSQEPSCSCEQCPIWLSFLFLQTCLEKSGSQGEYSLDSHHTFICWSFYLHPQRLYSYLPQSEPGEAELYGLHHVRFLALSVTVGPTQWKIVTRHQRVIRENSQNAYSPPLPARVLSGSNCSLSVWSQLLPLPGLQVTVVAAFW